jgi:hypothetical protein
MLAQIGQLPPCPVTHCQPNELEPNGAKFRSGRPEVEVRALLAHFFSDLRESIWILNFRDSLLPSSASG